MTRTPAVMEPERSVRWSGVGAIDLVALILLLFLIWLAAMHDFPRYQSRAGSPAPRVTPATPAP